ncbi:MAG: YybH family protein [Actinomycetota bacterium]
MDRRDVERWMEGYLHAWDSNDPEDVGRLFSDDARYYTAPHREPWTGRNGIVSGWIDHRDQPGTWEFRYEVLGIDGEVAFVRGWTLYHATSEEAESAHSNLWVIRLDGEGRCSEFIEWWMEYSPGR